MESTRSSRRGTVRESHRRQLTSLNLWSNHIGDDGAADLAKARTMNSTLKWLNFEGNPHKILDKAPKVARTKKFKKIKCVVS